MLTPDQTEARIERCENCRFRKPDQRLEYATSGQCRRYPPIAVETTAFDGSGANHFSQWWPWMDGNDWCGEWKEPSHDQQS